MQRDTYYGESLSNLPEEILEEKKANGKTNQQIKLRNYKPAK